MREENQGLDCVCPVLPREFLLLHMRCAMEFVRSVGANQVPFIVAGSAEYFTIQMYNIPA